MNEAMPLQSSVITRLQMTPLPPFNRAVLWLLLALVFTLLAWATFGRLDIVAVAEGKLVPQTALKIVQPVEQGRVKEILVREGEAVRQGQVLLRMDAVASNADGQMLLTEFQQMTLALRRIDAELAGSPMARNAHDPVDTFRQVQAQYQANRLAYQSALDEQRSVQERAVQEMAAAREISNKLQQVMPHYRQQEQAYEQLGKDGFAGRLMVADKQRERIEKEQDLKAQEFAMRSAQAVMQQAQKRMAQIGADYRRQLQTERAETTVRHDKLSQELAKQQHRQAQLELVAPQQGIVKDLATHTPGTVVAPGTVLLTLVPANEPLLAEVWVSNADIGFVRAGQPVKVKLSAFSFQKYGMVSAVVEQVSADASDAQGDGANGNAQRGEPPRLTYKARVKLTSQQLVSGGKSYSLSPGMQVSAEIILGTRTVLEYLLSPVRGAFHDAARER